MNRRTCHSPLIDDASSSSGVAAAAAAETFHGTCVVPLPGPMSSCRGLGSCLRRSVKKLGGGTVSGFRYLFYHLLLPPVFCDNFYRTALLFSLLPMVTAGLTPEPPCAQCKATQAPKRCKKCKDVNCEPLAVRSVFFVFWIEVAKLFSVLVEYATKESSVIISSIVDSGTLACRQECCVAVRCRRVRSIIAFCSIRNDERVGFRAFYLLCFCQENPRVV